MKKTIALVVTLVLVGTFALSATMAYLTGQTAPVTNVFVIGDIKISLEELNWNTNKVTDFKGKIIPGETILKEPTVTVTKGSEPCYLYMYLENTLAVSTGTNAWDYVTPNINKNINSDANQWVRVGDPIVNATTGAKKELYRYNATGGIIDAKDAEKKLTFFSEVTVPGKTFTKESMNNNLTGNKTMTVEAFAYQAQNVNLVDADNAAKEKYLTAY